MAYRIILCTAILTLSLSPNHLQASPLKLISSFSQPAPTEGLAAIHLKIYPSGTFQDFRVIETPPGWESLLPGNGDSLKKLFLHQPPTLLADSTLSLPRAPALSPTPPNPAKKGNLSDRVMSLALTHLHAPYRRGGSLQTGRGTDCSGFVRHVYQNINIDLPHSSAQQARLGKVAAHRMDFSKLEVGDLLFFSRARSIDHVGIYAGEGKMIHASSRRRGVIITDLRQAYFTGNFVVAKRLLKQP
jgi:cell wall-associated NlpC family hydrolase